MVISEDIGNLCCEREEGHGERGRKPRSAGQAPGSEGSL